MNLEWLNLKERELERGIVDIDVMLKGLGEEDDDVGRIRDKLQEIWGAFNDVLSESARSLDKNRTLDMLNSNLRKDIEILTTEKRIQIEENDILIQQIHCMQLRLLSLDEGSIEGEEILERLSKEMEERMNRARPFAQLEASKALLEAENYDLKQYIHALQTELYGARLAAKYLDKELAGRIQQIQLLGNKIHGQDYQQLWSTIESEINLQRHKTVIKACKGPTNLVIKSTKEPPKEAFNTIRHVKLVKTASENLGMSVTGGKEHGVPLLISEIYSNQLVANSGLLFVGDAILSVNGINLSTMRHSDAVKTLCQPMEEINLDVVYIANHDIEDVHDVSNVYVTDTGYKYQLYQHPGLKLDHNSNEAHEQRNKDLGNSMKAGKSHNSENQ